MYPTIRLLSAAAALLSVCSATFLNPVGSSSWSLGSEQTIEWETAGLQEPLQMHLCPGGSTQVSQSIVELAPNIGNTGWWKWTPTQSIPQHQSFVIIIVDKGGHHQISDPFKMIGWPGQVVPPPAAHTSIIVHTSVIQPPPSLHVSLVVITSHLAPIIRTSIVAPIVQTEVVAPIVITKTQEPITQIIPQAPLVTTEIQAPIVKTVLITETPAPIVREITREPLTKVETKAPIVMTEVQAPIIKTLTQAPQIITEQPAAVVITQHLTQTIHPPPIHTVITEHVVIQPGHTVAPPQHIAPPNVHTSVIVHPGGVAPPSAHTSIPVLKPLTPQYPGSSSHNGIPTFQNGTGAIPSLVPVGNLQSNSVQELASTTGVEASATPAVPTGGVEPSAAPGVPAEGSGSSVFTEPPFERPTSVVEELVVDTSSAGFLPTTLSTRPVALAASAFSTTFPMGAAATTGTVPPLGGSFTGGAAAKHCAVWVGFVSSLLIALVI